MIIHCRHPRIYHCLTAQEIPGCPEPPLPQPAQTDAPWIWFTHGKRLPDLPERPGEATGKRAIASRTSGMREKGFCMLTDLSCRSGGTETSPAPSQDPCEMRIAGGAEQPMLAPTRPLQPAPACLPSPVAWLPGAPSLSGHIRPPTFRGDPFPQCPGLCFQSTSTAESWRFHSLLRASNARQLLATPCCGGFGYFAKTFLLSPCSFPCSFCRGVRGYGLLLPSASLL